VNKTTTTETEQTGEQGPRAAIKTLYRRSGAAGARARIEAAERHARDASR